MPQLSLIICAFNRCESVQALLDCLLVQVMSYDNYEILVVDNNSKDGTRGMVESYLPGFEGRLRYFFEPEQGKSFALNRGIRESKGEILVFTDDDCLVEKDYLAQVEKFFQENGEAIDFLGGKILPCWTGDCPAWLSEILSEQTGDEFTDERYWRKVFFRGPLAILDYGSTPFRVDISQKLYKGFLFYGPNMAVRKRAFEKAGCYATDRVITQDTEMCLRLIKSGMKGWYAPQVRVFHRVDAARLKPQFYYQWYFRRGKFLGPDVIVQKKIYHPLGIQNEFILRTFLLFLKSMTTISLRDKIHYRSQGLFNIGQMQQIAKNNIIGQPEDFIPGAIPSSRSLPISV
jgi:glycosyltransferase involved in cell wall biosynthesis